MGPNGSNTKKNLDFYLKSDFDGGFLSLTFPLEDCLEFGNFVITLILRISYFMKFPVRLQDIVSEIKGIKRG